MAGVNDELPEECLPEGEGQADMCCEEEICTACEADSTTLLSSPGTKRTVGNGDGMHIIIHEMRRRVKNQLFLDNGRNASSAGQWNQAIWDAPLTGQRTKWTFKDILPRIFFLAILFTMIALLSTRSSPLRRPGSSMEKVVGELQHTNRSLTNKCRTLEETVLVLKEELLQLKNNIHNVCALSSVQEHNIRKVVDRSLAIYDADKTGLADYALESAGGTVLGATSPVTSMLHLLQFLGLPVGDYSPCGGPRCIIQPSVQPGHCWRFRGATGKVKIRLARKIHVTAVTLEHTPAEIETSGNISCAPKRFFVYAMLPGPGKSLIEINLGSFVYDIGGAPLQTFKIQDAYAERTSIVELWVVQNHGDADHTCVCRFRVHGVETYNDSVMTEASDPLSKGPQVPAPSAEHSLNL